MSCLLVGQLFEEVNHLVINVSNGIIYNLPYFNGCVVVDICVMLLNAKRRLFDIFGCWFSVIWIEQTLLKTLVSR
jgi:hypothetical protein